MTGRLDLTRVQILAYRRNVQALDERLPAGLDSLRQAARAGLQDSMPRAALLSIHARVAGTGPSTWADARAAFAALSGSLTPARTPVGDGWILTGDEPRFRAPTMPTSAARLLPSGDAFFPLPGVRGQIRVRWDT